MCCKMDQRRAVIEILNNFLLHYLQTVEKKKVFRHSESFTQFLFKVQEYFCVFFPVCFCVALRNQKKPQPTVSACLIDSRPSRASDHSQTFLQLHPDSIIFFSRCFSRFWEPPAATVKTGASALKNLSCLTFRRVFFLCFPELIKVAFWAAVR